jgi:hypothetical protein
MTVRLPLAAAALALLALAPQAFAPRAMAQEVIVGSESGAPPAPHSPAAPPAQVGDPRQSPAAIGAWANNVLAGRPNADPQQLAEAQGPGACDPPPDRKPHGEVWAGVGTRGYREAGGVVTMPVGDCGHVTVAIDKTEFAGRHRR